MIYMVDHVYADPATEREWHEWYAGYLSKLLSVPGLRTAQRFKALAHTPSRYLAMYSIDSADVYDSEPYKRIGGGGSQSARFHPAYQLWTRNLFDAVRPASPTNPALRATPPLAGGDSSISPGQAEIAKPAAAIHAPAVRAGQRVLVFDREEPPRPADLHPNATTPESKATWLEAVGLHRTTKYRAYLVLAAGEPAPPITGSRLYEPFAAVLTAS